MERLKRYVFGGHSPVEIRWHLALLVAGYWGLVLCAWLGYPAENHFSVTTAMLSALGSFEERYNPRWYWVFSVAMVYCGVCMVPVMLYVRRRLSAVSAWGASVGAFFFLLGCAAIMLTGLFPYAHRDFLGWRLAHLHMNAAALITASFALGFVWHGLLLLQDRFTRRTFDRVGPRPYLRFIGPFVICIPVILAVGQRIDWKLVLAGNMDGAFSGMVHFPLLEHVAIWTLTVFVVWFTVVLPHPGEETAR
jgi:hypothetical protein